MHYLRNHRCSLSHLRFCSALIPIEDSRSTALKHLLPDKYASAGGYYSGTINGGSSFGVAVDVGDVESVMSSNFPAPLYRSLQFHDYTYLHAAERSHRVR